MGFKTGFVGLPNVGKSTIFNALTSAKAEAENYPFCTIEPNTGMVKVPDERLPFLQEFAKTDVVIPATITFVDIAGLVKGASKGEGLGNQFLGHIREVSTISHVCRCFNDDNVVHVDGSVDPIRDLEIIETELVLADLESVSKKFDTLKKTARGGNKEASKIIGVLEPIKAGLEDGKTVRSLGLDPDQLDLIKHYHFLTAKKSMYIANVSETDLENPDGNPYVTQLKEYAAKENSPVVVICGKLEAEIAELSGEEKEEFLKDMGLKEPGLNQIIRTGYGLLDLQTYFTAGVKEVRAWTIHRNWTAPQAAGVIHTDFEKGFIKAEVYHYDDAVKYQSEQAIRDAGALRLEGKEYIVQDGDVMHFRFNV